MRPNPRPWKIIHGRGFLLLHSAPGAVGFARQPTPPTMTATDKLTATEARNFAKRILAETIFTNVKAKNGWGGWEINIDGGEAACYGRTIRTAEGAADIIDIFAR